jgi:hypothetical protein
VEPLTVLADSILEQVPLPMEVDLVVVLMEHRALEVEVAAAMAAADPGLWLWPIQVIRPLVVVLLDIVTALLYTVLQHQELWFIPHTIKRFQLQATVMAHSLTLLVVVIQTLPIHIQ